MARPPGVAGGRTVVVATRFTPTEAARMDAMRGSLSRSEWLRWLQQQAAKRSQTP